MASLGDLYWELRARQTKLASDIEAAAGKAGTQAGKVAGDTFNRSFSARLGQLRTDFNRQGGIIGAVLGGVGLGAGLGAFQMATKGIGLVTDAIGDAIQAASDMNESVSKSQVVFDKSAASVRAWADTSAKSMGISTQAALEQASTLGNLFLSMGKTSDEAAKMSTAMVQLAADIGSFNNVDPAEVLLAMRSGLTGEIAPLRRFGVNLTDVTLKAKAMALGLYNGKGLMDASAKSSAAYALILEQTKTSQGDFARTSGGLANKTKIAAAQMANLRANAGAFLQDAAKGFVGFLADVADWGQQAVVELAKLASTMHDIQRVFDPGSAKIEDWLKAFKAMPLAANLSDEVLTRFIQTQIALGHSLEFATQVAETQGIAFEKSGDAAERAAAQAQRAIDQWNGLPTTIENGVRLMGSTERVFIQGLAGMDDAAMHALLTAKNLPDDLRQALAGVAPVLQKTVAQVRHVAAQVPGSIGSGLRSQKSKVRSAMVALKYEMEHPITKAEVRAYELGQLHSARLARGLRSKVPAIKDAARAARTALIQGLMLTESVSVRFDQEGDAYTRRHPSTPRLAAGGPVRRGVPVIVGEHRPEVFVPEENGTILPSVGGSSRVDFYVHDVGGGLARAGISTAELANQLRRWED